MFHLCRGQRTLIPSSLTHVQVFYDFSLEDVIRQMFADPEFCEHRATLRVFSAAGYYGTEVAARIDKQIGGKLMQHNNSPYEWAMDDGQPLTFAKWSTGLLVMRCGASRRAPLLSLNV